jgi:hypothetical protein
MRGTASLLVSVTCAVKKASLAISMIEPPNMNVNRYATKMSPRTNCTQPPPRMFSSRIQ